MDIKNTGIDRAHLPEIGRGERGGRGAGGADATPDSSFRDTLSALVPAPASSVAAPRDKAWQPEPLKFSGHAVERMKSRGIQVSPSDLARLQDAVGRAQKKGSKDSLVLMNDSAFVVSVKNNTVVTVMDRNMMKDNVFTNIDSTIVV